MMLGDMGAEVIRIERAGALWHEPSRDPLLRNRRSLEVESQASAKDSRRHCGWSPPVTC